ncbi:MAG: hypothetical protein QG643_441 [Pseudomonadota bacterium]|jgi:thiol:disulfide interchange protein|nr:redoxin family protein [Giesbergeria sp.]MDQ1258618.1 hypothetical protein [Pseudomonadota bacterium]
MPAALGWLGQHLRKRWRAHTLNLLMLLGVLAGTHWWQTRNLPAGPLPALPLELTSGERLSLEQWRARHPGQATALYVWAHWCPICRVQEPTVTRLQQDHPVLTVALQSGQAAQVVQLQQQRQLPWTTAVDPEGQLAGALGVHAVPTLLVIDAQGKVTGSSVGYTSAWGMRLRLWWANW